MQEWVVDTAQRLDAFLGAEGRMLSRARAQKAIDAGLVSVNGRLQKKSALRLEPGDAVTLEEPEAEPASHIEPIAINLPVLYEDKACIVFSKPAGIAVHPGAGMEKNEATLLHGIAAIFKKKRIKFSSDSVLVHRLDRETTGCILVAKNAAAHIALQKQFEKRTVRKLYLALVAGVLEHKTAKIDSPIGRSASDRTKMAVHGISGAREASTTYRVLQETPDAALVLCDLHTGRTHQVRVHLHSIGHPVLGDPSYRTQLADRVGDGAGVANLCLHAWKLTFRSPADDTEHEVVCPLPSPFTDALKALGLTLPG